MNLGTMKLTNNYIIVCSRIFDRITAELAQSVERTTLNRVVVGSIPTFGEIVFELCNKNHCIDVYFIKDDSTLEEFSFH